MRLLAGAKPSERGTEPEVCLRLWDLRFGVQGMLRPSGDCTSPDAKKGKAHPRRVYEQQRMSIINQSLKPPLLTVLLPLSILSCVSPGIPNAKVLSSCTLRESWTERMTCPVSRVWFGVKRFRDHATGKLLCCWRKGRGIVMDSTPPPVVLLPSTSSCGRRLSPYVRSIR